MRKQRKHDARLKLLEFCLRPHLALLIYTLSVALIGRGLTHYTHAPPYSAIWWSEWLMWPFATLGWGSWDTYSSSPAVERALNNLELILGVTFLGLGLFMTYAPRMLSQALTKSSKAVVKSNEVRRSEGAHLHESVEGARGQGTHQRSSGARSRDDQALQDQLEAQMQSGSSRLADPPRGAVITFWLCLGGCALQSLYAVASCINTRGELATLLEYGVQICTPLAVAMLLPNIHPRFERVAERIVCIGVSLTFIGHGLYALNIAPTPSHFLTMTLNLTPLSEGGARWFLSAVGALDLLAALCVWLPIAELRRASLIYMVVWGGLTALARPLGMPINEWYDRVVLWGPELLWRTSHSLAPWWLWLRLTIRERG